jgi:hypothetical protein
MMAPLAIVAHLVLLLMDSLSFLPDPSVHYISNMQADGQGPSNALKKSRRVYQRQQITVFRELFRGAAYESGMF